MVHDHHLFRSYAATMSCVCASNHQGRMKLATATGDVPSQGTGCDRYFAWRVECFVGVIAAKAAIWRSTKPIKRFVVPAKWFGFWFAAIHCCDVPCDVSHLTSIVLPPSIGEITLILVPKEVRRYLTLRLALAHVAGCASISMENQPS